MFSDYITKILIEIGRKEKSLFYMNRVDVFTGLRLKKFTNFSKQNTLIVFLN
jgi:hypothetical protein